MSFSASRNTTNAHSLLKAISAKFPKTYSCTFCSDIARTYFWCTPELGPRQSLEGPAVPKAAASLRPFMGATDRRSAQVVSPMGRSTGTCWHWLARVCLTSDRKVILICWEWHSHSACSLTVVTICVDLSAFRFLLLGAGQSSRLPRGTLKLTPTFGDR